MSVTDHLNIRILVAEDRLKTADLMRRALEGDGHSVLLAYDGDRALTLGKSAEIDVILLDLMLPRLDGFSVLKKLREAHLRTAVIIVSARDTLPEIVHGLNSGADDYLTKPFELEMLLARVRAVGRRAPAAQPAQLTFQDLVLKPGTHELQRGERAVQLTRTEYALLEVLMRRAGAVVSREILMQEGWGEDSEPSGANLYVFIRALRSKITQPGEEELLHTVRGVGYSLRSEPF
jgi:DNA-binding response OmpR family regulator